MQRTRGEYSRHSKKVNVAKGERVRGRVVIEEVRKVIWGQIIMDLETFNLSEMGRHVIILRKKKYLPLCFKTICFKRLVL